MTKRFLTAILILEVVFLSSLPAVSQNLDSLLDKEVKLKTTFATATFKSTRVINGHSVQNMKKNQLEFRISHRFGDLNSGGYNLYGLDYGTIHFALEYGLTDWLELGLGRSTYEKTVDGFAKISLLQQSTGTKNMPVHLSYLFSTEYITLDYNPLYTNSSSRMSFIQQILLARKFNESLSLQLTPTYIHRNQIPTLMDQNDLLAMGIGGRYKLTKRMSLNVEYYYVHRTDAGSLPEKYYNPLAIGIDIETGGHVFQIMVSNSTAMREGGFIGKTTGSWGDGGIHLGFNISRVFSFNKK